MPAATPVAAPLRFTALALVVAPVAALLAGTPGARAEPQTAAVPPVASADAEPAPLVTPTPGTSATVPPTPVAAPQPAVSPPDEPVTAEPGADSSPPSGSAPAPLTPGASPGTSSAVTIAPPGADSPATTAHIELHTDRPGCWLELRASLGDESWTRACPAPCGVDVTVDGRLARISGTGVTPSNAFRIDPGTGTVRLDAATGSSRARRGGTVALATGLPLALAGLAAFAIGVQQDSALLKTGGASIGAIGGTAVVVAFPLLRAGSTRVRDDRGRRIATAVTEESRF